ncbi:MAG: arylsulfotransferase family protein, partial [Bacteroidia bacterium]
NLKNDSILKRWKIENPWDEVARIVNPIYLPKDGSLIYNYYYTGRPGLIKLDSNGNEVWKNDSLVIHHGMNLGHDGNLWACSIYRGKASGKYNIAEKDVFYNDYRINKFDIETGQIIFDKSITEILNENNLSNYLFKSVSTTEPLHLNDVQPALKNTKYYKKDDVFISLRNIHAIMHYRPSTNQLIDLLEGPFINQHDVDFLNDSTLAIFNNNTFVEVSQKSRKAHKDTSRLTDAGKFYSNIVSYGFNNEQFNFIGDSVFKANRIFTKNEGLMEFLGPNTYFVEEQNPGLLWVIENNKVVLKHVLKSPYEGYHHLPNWTRIVQYGSKKF